MSGGPTFHRRVELRLFRCADLQVQRGHAGGGELREIFAGHFRRDVLHLLCAELARQRRSDPLRQRGSLTRGVRAFVLLDQRWLQAPAAAQLGIDVAFDRFQKVLARGVGVRERTLKAIVA